LTIKENDIEIPKNLINVEFVFLGQITHNEVLWMFKNIHCMVFPSYIETLGLPLIEAASFGLPILASDLSYAREVLDGYKGVEYIEYQNTKSWGSEILKISNQDNIRFKPYIKENIKSWADFFSLIIEKI